MALMGMPDIIPPCPIIIRIMPIMPPGIMSPGIMPWPPIIP